MLFSPTNLYPSILSGTSSIDASIANEFSAQINGNSKVIKYRWRIYRNNASSTLVYDTNDIILPTPLYPVDYNGNNQRITVIIPNNSGMQNGLEYKYTIEVFDSSMSIITTEEAFKTAKTPSINLNVPSNITMKYHEFIGTYTQENNVPIKHFSWTLKNITTNRIIKETDEIYSQDIRLYYDGFLTGNKYSIKLKIVNQDNIELDTGEVVFNVTYDIFPVSGMATVSQSKKESSVKIDLNPIIIIGEPDGNFEFIDNDPFDSFTSVHIPIGKRIFFTEQNGREIKIPSNTTHVIRTRVNPMHSGHVIYRASGANYFMEVFTKDYLLYLNINNQTQILLCEQNSIDDIITLIISPQFCKVKIVRKYFALYPSEILYPSNNLYPQDGRLESTESTNNISYFNINESYSSLKLFGEQYVDYLWIADGVISDSDVDMIMENDYEPTWEHEKTLVLAKFNHNYEAGNSFIGIPGFVNWDVYREDIDNQTLTFIKRIKAESNGLVDYLAPNIGNFRYYLYPIGSYGIGIPLLTNNININNKEWVLITSVQKEDVLIPVKIYRFFANLDVSEIPNNNSPNVLFGFSRYPKVQTPNWNALSGVLTTLIGDFGLNCDEAYISSGGYIKTKELSNELYLLSTDNTRKFLKDGFGNVMEIKLSGAVSQKPNMKTEEILADVSLPWIQVNSADDISLVVEI